MRMLQLQRLLGVLAAASCLACRRAVHAQTLLVEDARGACEEPGMCDWDNTNNHKAHHHDHNNHDHLRPTERRRMRRRQPAAASDIEEVEEEEEEKESESYYNSDEEDVVDESDYLDTESNHHLDMDWVWESGTVQDMQEALDCQAQIGTSVQSEFYQDDTWQRLQTTYLRVVGPEQSSLARSSSQYSPGFVVEFDVQLFDAVGRGIVATTFVPQGTLVWTTANTATFTNGDHYRAFLQQLPSHLACDVMYWAYTRHDEHGQPMVCVDLDPGSFVNSGDDEEEINIGFLPGRHEEESRHSGCTMEFYALRDIRAGEEMRGDYAAFSEESLWQRLSL